MVAILLFVWLLLQLSESPYIGPLRRIHYTVKGRLTEPLLSTVTKTEAPFEAGPRYRGPDQPAKLQIRDRKGITTGTGRESAQEAAAQDHVVSIRGKSQPFS